MTLLYLLGYDCIVCLHCRGAAVSVTQYLVSCSRHLCCVPAIVSPPLPAFLTCYNTRRGVALIQDAVLRDIATTEQLIQFVNRILRTYLQYLAPMVHT